MNISDIRRKVNLQSKRDRRLRVATWTVSRLCSERKQREVSEVLSRPNIDVVAGQESWEREERLLHTDGLEHLAIGGKEGLVFFGSGVFSR